MSFARPPVSFVVALVLTLCMGFVAGRLLGLHAIPAAPLRTYEDTQAPVPTLVIDGVENGAIVGTAQGTMRVLVSGEAYVVAPGEFRIPAAAFREVLTVRVPEGMRFVASKSGKKYYDVTSAAGGRIALENRVYFRTAADAQAAGYSP